MPVCKVEEVVADFSLYLESLSIFVDIRYTHAVVKGEIENDLFLPLNLMDEITAGDSGAGRWSENPCSRAQCTCDYRLMPTIVTYCNLCQ